MSDLRVSLSVIFQCRASTLKSVFVVCRLLRLFSWCVPGDASPVKLGVIASLSLQVSLALRIAYVFHVMDRVAFQLFFHFVCHILRYCSWREIFLWLYVSLNFLESAAPGVCHCLHCISHNVLNP